MTRSEDASRGSAKPKTRSSARLKLVSSNAPDRSCGWGSRDPRPGNHQHSSARKLADEQKEFVVHRLAAFDRLAVVQRALLEKFGVDLSYQSIARYDPTRSQGKALSEKWKAIFHATRDALLKGSAEIGASHVLVRLRWRERMALDAMEAGNAQLANTILDSIAAEVEKHKLDQAGARLAPVVPTINITVLEP